MVEVDGGGHDDALRPPFPAQEKRLTDAVEQAYRNARRPVDGLGPLGTSRATRHVASDLGKGLWALLGSNQRPLPCKHWEGPRQPVRWPASMDRNRCGCVRFTPWRLSLIPIILGQLGGPWGDRSVPTGGRPERSDPLTVGRPPASLTAAPPLVGGRIRGARGAGAPRGQGRAGDLGSVRIGLAHACDGLEALWVGVRGAAAERSDEQENKDDNDYQDEVPPKLLGSRLAVCHLEPVLMPLARIKGFERGGGDLSDSPASRVVAGTK